METRLKYSQPPYFLHNTANPNSLRVLHNTANPNSLRSFELFQLIWVGEGRREQRKNLKFLLLVTLSLVVVGREI